MPSPDGPEQQTLTLSTQSIGRGVPAEAAQAFAQIQTLLRSAGYRAEAQAWGLEGEKRLCVVLAGADSRALLQQITKLADATELLRAETQPDPDNHCPPER